MRLPTRKWVYVFHIRATGLALPLYLGKVGFESDGTDRAGDVEYSIRQKLGMEVKVRRVIRVKVFMYRAIEKAVHNFMRKFCLHSNKLRGCSGWTEIFHIFNFLTGLIILCTGYWVGWDCAPWLAGCWMLIPYPLDMLFCVCFLAALEYALYAAIGWLAWIVGASLMGL
jgi:hypothetical protein